MTSNKIVPFCKLVVGRPKLCFGKSIFPSHLSSVFVAESLETGNTAKGDEKVNMLPSESSSELCSVYKLAIQATLFVKFV